MIKYVNMKLTINGEGKNIESGKSISGLLTDSHVNSKAVVVEVNLSIINKEKYDSTNLQDGDVVEIVKFMGGG